MNILFALLVLVAGVASANFSKSEQAIVQDNLCPSGWKETNLCLRDYHNNVFDAYVRVEICSDNGLIRVKP